MSDVTGRENDGDSPLSRVLLQLEPRTDDTLDGTIVATIVATGFPSLDRALQGGFRRGDLVVLGGDAGSGVSSLALGIALRCIPRALLVTGEMHEERVFERALAISARVALESIRHRVLSDEERARITMIAPGVAEWGPVVDTLTHGGTDLLWTAHDRAIGAPLVIVDGIESLLARDFDVPDALGGVLLELKRFALERNVAVLALSHLPGLDRARHDKRPRLSDFGARGAAGVHADLVLGLFREEQYDADLAVSGAAELVLLKNRNGALEYVDLYFATSTLRFQDVLDPDS
ncbi:MAG TPA: DnaB-like helicase C-terminal domain-containing protein [Gemmatimonas sp.]|nr:DnaB-like helicase C-terminal domain-containing protein [Gemmatimonas sp.]